MRRPVPEDVKAGVLTDYAAGMSTLGVSRKYGIGSASAHRIVKAAGISRTMRGAKERARARRDAEYGLNGGHWMPNPRGIQVWQPCFYDSIQRCNINHQENTNAA